MDREKSPATATNLDEARQQHTHHTTHDWMRHYAGPASTWPAGRGLMTTGESNAVRHDGRREAGKNTSHQSTF